MTAAPIGRRLHVEVFGACNFAVADEILAADVSSRAASCRGPRGKIVGTGTQLIEPAGRGRQAWTERGKALRELGGGPMMRLQTGRVNQNRVMPASESTPTWPPLASTSRCTMARPMPAPPLVRSRDLSTR